MAFAARLHGEQRRKGSNVPYISHLLAVAAMVIEHGADEDEAIAALLHDAIEDQGGPEARDAIRRRFGARVVSIVDGCSDTDRWPKPPWRERKEAYLARIGGDSPSIRLVSIADKLHNVRCTLRDYRAHGDAVWERFRGGRDGTLWYFRALVVAFRQTAAAGDARERPLLEDLDRAVTRLESLVARPDRENAGQRPSG